jgi:hypothetical protein
MDSIKTNTDYLKNVLYRYRLKQAYGRAPSIHLLYSPIWTHIAELNYFIAVYEKTTLQSPKDRC